MRATMLHGNVGGGTRVRCMCCQMDTPGRLCVHKLHFCILHTCWCVHCRLHMALAEIAVRNHDWVRRRMKAALLLQTRGALACAYIPGWRSHRTWQR